jgi:hypothetical protein
MRPFNEGYRAFMEGNLANPYKENTKENRDWEYGFNKAYFTNLERRSVRTKVKGRGAEVSSSRQKETSFISH